MAAIKELLMAKLFGGSGGGGGDAHGIPSGGTTAQVLAKTSGTDYAAGWTTPHYIPSGGTTGQVLAISSNTDYAAGWTTPRDVPSGGSAGQILTRYGYGNDYRWQDLSIPADKLIESTWLDEENGRTSVHLIGGDLTYILQCGKKLRIYDSETENTIMYLIAANDYYDSVQDETESWAYFLDVSDQNVFPRIRYFKKEYDDYWGDYVYYEQTPPTHTVTGAWVGTAAEYAALSPNYDANTIYYIKE